MNQETRSLLAVGLSVAIFVLWYSFLAPKKTQEGQQSQQGQQGQQGQQPAASNNQRTNAPTDQQTNTPTHQRTNALADPQAGIPIQTTVVESDLYRVELTNDGGVPVSWKMKKFTKGNGNGETFVELISEGAVPLLAGDSSGTLGLPERPRYEVDVEKEINGNTKVVYSWTSKGVAFSKTYNFNPNSYAADLNINVVNKTNNVLTVPLVLGWSAIQPEAKNRGFLGFLKGPEDIVAPVYFLDGKTLRDPVVKKEGNLMWGGTESRYFISAIIPRLVGGAIGISAASEPVESGRKVEANVQPPALSILPGGQAIQSFSVYAGPKEITALKSVGVGLEKGIDYGWFSLIAMPILYLLKFFYGVISNYGIAIILLTVFAKLLMHPLSRHSMKSMKAMQTLQPKLKELKEKYKNDKERINMETMQLFKAHKVNPMGGCLPMLIQLPIYIALYKVLWNSIELYRAPFFWFYRDLASPDPFFIMPALLGVAMWLQQKLTPSASADPAQAKMMQIMPIMFTAFMLFLPSGLVLYIFVNTIMGVAQQYMTNHDLRLRDVLRGRFAPQKI